MPESKVQAIVEVTKSPNDDRAYRGMVLNNGMKVLLISDPSTDKSAAALDVRVGNMCDPDDLEGLAHFCEHMLFLGTEKYPEEDEYKRFLSEHGGSSNASTSRDHTKYFFDVAPDGLQGALDRFAQFFLCPLFTPSATEREVNAVNSENDKNIKDDGRRLYQLSRATANQKHPYSKFSTGNKDTLMNWPQERGVNTRAELLEFHKKHYSANIMTLVVLGQETLEDLETNVLQLFDGVEDKNLEAIEWKEHPYANDQLRVEIQAVPIKDIRSLKIEWPLPDLQQYYKSKPGSYLSHLIGHEGPGSLLSELKNRGWATSLSAGGHTAALGFGFFTVSIDLSDSGLDHTDDIVLLVFQYLAMLRHQGPQEWIFNECQDLKATKFRFKDKEQPRSYTTRCASNLHDYPLEEALRGNYLMEEFRPDLITMVTNLLTPDNVRVYVRAMKFEGQTDRIDKWYGTEYSVNAMPEDTLQIWRAAGLTECLQLPSVNIFLPEDFDLVERDLQSGESPRLVRDSDRCRLWYKQDDRFLLPKACVTLQYTSPMAYCDPHHVNLMKMYIRVVNDALTEYTYYADLAGLYYKLSSNSHGLEVEIHGYSDKLPLLLDKITTTLISVKVEPQRFNLLKEKYVRHLGNHKAEQPWKHTRYYARIVLKEQNWTVEELLASVEGTTVESLEAFIPSLLSTGHVEALAYGNLTKQRAMGMIEAVEARLAAVGVQPLLPYQRRYFRQLQLPEGGWYLYRRVNTVHPTQAVEVYYQCGIESTHCNMVLELLTQIIKQPCFDTLRTKEQLGYIVFCNVFSFSGVQGLNIRIQSKHLPAHLDERGEAFLAAMLVHLTEMSHSVFTNHVGALASKRLEKAKNQVEQQGRYWHEIDGNTYSFNRDEIEVAHLRSLTKEDVLNFFKERVSADSAKRRKLSVYVESDVTDQTSHETVVTPADMQPTVIQEVETFKKQQSLLPYPCPVIPLVVSEPEITVQEEEQQQRL